nr:hypothetical protein [Tanacetum cinerariifolium]
FLHHSSENSWQWEHPLLAVGTYTASGNFLLAVGTPSTSSGNLYCQWELSPGSGNALCILFPTLLLFEEFGQSDVLLITKNDVQLTMSNPQERVDSP